MTTNRSITRSPVFLVGVLIVAAFAITIALNAGGDGGSDVAEATETAAVVITGESLPPFADDDAARGLPAPAVTGLSFDDSAVDLSQPAARIYGFFAHWCPHCQRELPIVQAWIEEGLVPDGVEFVAVSTAVERSADNFPPSAWFTDVGYDATVLVDDDNNSVANAFGLPGFPYWVATDGDGNVVARAGGAVDRDGFEALIALAEG
ncbi:MAG: TlpA disulfide reductase family protein [Actinomycetota bacterium]